MFTELNISLGKNQTQTSPEQEMEKVIIARASQTALGTNPPAVHGKIKFTLCLRQRGIVHLPKICAKILYS